MIRFIDLAAKLRAKEAGFGRKTADCPSCGYPSALALTGGDDGRALWHCFAGCDRDRLSEAIKTLTGRNDWTPPPAARRSTNKAPSTSEAALRLWQAARPAQGTLAALYLKGRGLC
jgi:hypothetical protein